MRLIALADLPHRVKAGERFDVTDVVGRILVNSGVATEVPEADEDQPSRRRTYKRRDLQAES